MTVGYHSDDNLVIVTDDNTGQHDGIYWRRSTMSITEIASYDGICKIEPVSAVLVHLAIISEQNLVIC